MQQSDLLGLNVGYVMDLYERWQQDPNAVDAQTREFFRQWTPPAAEGQHSADDDHHHAHAARDHSQQEIAQAADKVMAVVRLAQEIRGFGHMAAQLDPLGAPPPGDPNLSPDAHGLTDADLRTLPASLVGGPVAERAANALEAIERLRGIYSAHLGYDYEHLRSPEERAWLRQAAESRQFAPTEGTFDPVAMLNRLTEVEVFEQFLHRMFPGKHRFSIEGLDTMVPLLDEVIRDADAAQIQHMSIGMAHRGRLNVLAHTLGKPYNQILAEFRDPVKTKRFEDDLGWTGDVKYHKGATRRVTDSDEVALTIYMPPNPSHLEAINPIVAGMARASGTTANRGGAPHFDPNLTLPVIIHGDAAFPGQGIVAETLNMSRLPGYWTGGTIHVIANNQLGFTTDPNNARSTLYASDLAKGFSIPIVHVNADDPEAVVEAARLAFAYRQRFMKDFVIDLIGYRKWGHNEGDEPAFTQPLQYEVIRNHPTARALWADRLVQSGKIAAEAPQEAVSRVMTQLQKALEGIEAADLPEEEPTPPPPGTARKVKTGVAVDQLQALNEALLRAPDGFTLHPKLAKIMERRREGLKDAETPSVDWSAAEQLAFATILADGTPIRVTGQDVERGTFSHRHDVFHDVNSGETWTPLQVIEQANAAFEICNSPLSEEGALAYEYGYNVQEPCRLVVWEAQYGDFINGAQNIVDEFIVSARAKWGQTPSLVMLLPHGFEGAGPDHSSGRLERFLNQAAETNMRVANATTAAQYFHLLRRQAMTLESDPLPLVVMTPKSLLRNANVMSSLRELEEGRWQPVIDDARITDEGREEITTLVLVSGKLYADLVASEYAEKDTSHAIVRVEQLYPFPADEIVAVMESYPNLKDVIWAQEEPQNMGAYEFVFPLLTDLIDERWTLQGIARERNSSPAEGSAAAHAANQTALIEQIYGMYNPEDSAEQESKTEKSAEKKQHVS